MVGGTRGGLNRARIINVLSDSPMNAHQLSQELELDYSTIRHHLEVKLLKMFPSYNVAWAAKVDNVMYSWEPIFVDLFPPLTFSTSAR